MKHPSKERGCVTKINLGKDYIKNADRLSRKHRKMYGVYECPYCLGYHLTSKVEKAAKYKPLLYVTATYGES